MMVCIGMVVTIPRMSATTHELGVSQIIPNVPLIVSVLAFFVICFTLRWINQMLSIRLENG